MPLKRLKIVTWSWSSSFFPLNVEESGTFKWLNEIFQNRKRIPSQMVQVGLNLDLLEMIRNINTVLHENACLIFFPNQTIGGWFC